MTDHNAPTFMAENGNPTIGVGALAGESAQSLPSAIGRYRIIRLLGEGGMGAVYEAEQDSPKRTVALKVIRAGFATGEMLRRSRTRRRRLVGCSIQALRRFTTRARRRRRWDSSPISPWNW